MNNNFIHLLQIPITGVGIRPFRGQDWYAYRLDILKRYTLTSLLNQSERSFVLWFCFRPEEKDNPLTKELEKWLKEHHFTAFMTFTGLPYWDDKFSRGLRERLKNAARIVRMAYREKNLLGFGWKNVVKEFFADKNGTLKARMAIALKVLKENLRIDAFDWVYVSRIDSDDMFSHDFVKEVHSFPPFPGALTCRNGYVYNSNTDQLAEWKPKTNPPFHTIIFPKETFFDAARYVQYFRGFKSHEDIPTVFNSQNLKDGKYCVLIHQKHISTIWEHPWKGKEIEDKDEILGKFGIGPAGKYYKMDGHKFWKPFEGEQNKAMHEILADYNAYGDRIWEAETTKKVKELVKEGDVCVDVGASIGYFTLLFSRLVGPKGRVYAFEPTDNQFRYLNANVELNGYQDRVQTYNLAAWDKKEDNYVRRDETLSDKTSARVQVNAGFEKPIKGVVLDDILPEKVDFIKIDVDGSESKVLKGLMETFKRNPQLKMVIEYYPECQKRLGCNPQEMMNILNKYFIYTKIPGEYTEEYYNLFCKRKC